MDDDIGMREREFLVKVRELISKRENWTKGAMARDGEGRTVPFDSDKAQAFCLVGAMWKVAGAKMESIGTVRVVKQLLRLDTFQCAENFNDVSTHAEVLARLDATIGRLG